MMNELFFLISFTYICIQSIVDDDHHSAQVNKIHAITAIPNEILCFGIRFFDPNRVEMGALEVLDDVDAADVPEETWLS